MDLIDDDKHIESITKMLKGLPRVNAPADFDTVLWQRINSESFESKYKKERWWEKFLSPAKLIPAAGLALAAVIIFFVLNLSGNDSENPLVAAPKIRHDLVTATPKVHNIPLQNEQNNGSLESSAFTASINKSGYNFLQVRLSDMEKERIERLKAKIQGYFNKNNK